MEIKRARENINESVGKLLTVLTIKGTAEDLDLAPMMQYVMFYFDNEKDPEFVVENHREEDIRVIHNGRFYDVQPDKKMHVFKTSFPSTFHLEIMSEL